MKYVEETIIDGRESQTENQFLTEYRQALMQVNSSAIAESPFIYMTRQTLSTALTRIQLFEKMINVPGSIVECGVYKGNSLMLYYTLSSIYEPYNLSRKIIGFDTFEGFPSISEKDGDYRKQGELNSGNYETICKWGGGGGELGLHDKNRPIGHLKKLELVKGDACITIPEYVKNNPHLVISLLYLDFDLYEPTKAALQYLLPLVPKGGIVGFDELNDKRNQGETIAMREVIGIGNVNLRKFTYEPHVSYFVVE